VKKQKMAKKERGEKRVWGMEKGEEREEKVWCGQRGGRGRRKEMGAFFERGRKTNNGRHKLRGAGILVAPRASLFLWFWILGVLFWKLGWGIFFGLFSSPEFRAFFSLEVLSFFYAFFFLLLGAWFLGHQSFSAPFRGIGKKISTKRRTLQANKRRTPKAIDSAL
jgi:hypothetical protein